MEIKRNKLLLRIEIVFIVSYKKKKGKKEKKKRKQNAIRHVKMNFVQLTVYDVVQPYAE